MRVLSGALPVVGRPLPVAHGRQALRIARIDPNAIVIGKNVPENDRLDLFSRQLVSRDLIDLLLFERGEKTLHPRIIKAVPNAAETLHQAAARKLRAESHAGVLASTI